MVCGWLFIQTEPSKEEDLGIQRPKVNFAKTKSSERTRPRTRRKVRSVPKVARKPKKRKPTSRKSGRSEAEWAALAKRWRTPVQEPGVNRKPPPHCTDSVKHPVTSLRYKRDQAIIRGMKWMDAFAERRWSFSSLGIDSVYIFIELAENSCNPYIRSYSLKVAQRLASRMKGFYLLPKKLDNVGELFDAMDLLTMLPFLKISPQPLLTETAKAFERTRKKGLEKLYGVDMNALTSLNNDDTFDVMINIYISDKAALMYPGAFRSGVSLEKMLPVLRQYPYVYYKKDKSKNRKVFSDDAFLATHVAFVVNNYSRLSMRIADIPKAYKFLRDNFAHTLKMKDDELVGEFVDVFRGVGLHEGNDAMVKQGTHFLLKSQNKDGSWGDWKKEKDAYDAIHYTWCAVHGLRERFVYKNTLFEKHIRPILKRINKSK